MKLVEITYTFKHRVRVGAPSALTTMEIDAYASEYLKQLVGQEGELESTSMSIREGLSGEQPAYGVQLTADRLVPVTFASSMTDEDFAEKTGRQPPRPAAQPSLFETPSDDS